MKKALLLYLTASLAGTNADGVRAKNMIDDALEHRSDIKYFKDLNETRYPPQMDEYKTALNLLIDVTPITPTNSSLRKFRKSPAAVCLADEAPCSPTDNCCQGGCSTSGGKCTCQAKNEWCFNYGGIDSFCCSNLCGANGRCECIPEGKSCAVGSDYCCSGLVCDSNSLVCTSQTSSKDVTGEPTQAPSKDKLPSPSPVSLKSNENPCIDVSVEIKTGKTDKFKCQNE